MLKKALSIFMLTLLLIGMLALSFSIELVKTEPAIITVPDDYPTIGMAIENAEPGDVIFVRAGVYHERLSIWKSVSLIAIDGSENTIIEGGIDVSGDNVFISNFTVRNSEYGIIIWGRNITMRNNRIINNSINFGVASSFLMGSTNLTHFIHDIDESNTIDGKPIYYIVNRKHFVVPDNAGYVAIINSSDITVRNLNLTKNWDGVLLVYANNCKVENVSLTKNKYGIRLSYSNNTFITNNVVDQCTRGIFLELYNFNNTISRNAVNANGVEGILLYWYNDYNIISDNIISRNYCGIASTDSAFNTYTNNTLVDNRYNWILTNADPIMPQRLEGLINYVDTTNTVDGKIVYYILNKRNVVIDPTQYPNAGYLAVAYSSNVSIQNLNLSSEHAFETIILANVTDCQIRNVNLTNNYITFVGCDNTLLTNSIMSGICFKVGAIGLYGRLINSNITISGNIINGTFYGIYGRGLRYSKIQSNIITNQSLGIGVLNFGNETRYNTFYNNTITNCGTGFIVYGSYHTLKYNNMTGNDCNFGLGCLRDNLLTLNIDPSNIVDGKPIFYLANQTDRKVPSNAGYVALVNSTRIIVEDLNIKNNYQGILLAFSNNCTVKNVTISHCTYGIRMDLSNENTIIENNIVNNNLLGVYLFSSVNNTFYHNNFINNKIHALGPNIWDNGYPSGGNYWSDYTGVDNNGDGIGDTSYVIDENNIDRYPLMAPFGCNVRVLNVTSSKTVVGQGFSVKINVTVQNFGFSEAGFRESFNVSLHINGTMLEMENVSLVAGETSTLTFTWNTTTFAKGNYTISAYAWPVPGETDIDDNTLVDGWIYIGIPGDVDVNGLVNMLDLYNIALHYGTTTADPDYIANYDINSDDIINMLDLYIAAIHYGETDP